jgi:hypothetical protein
MKKNSVWLWMDAIVDEVGVSTLVWDFVDYKGYVEHGVNRFWFQWN